MPQYNYKRILRFLAVGGSNALLHFTILNISFFFLGQTKIAASIIATIFAVMYSFFLNRNFVFRSKGKMTKQASSFVVVTLLGMLVIHNTIFILSLWFLESYGANISIFIKEILFNKISIDFINLNLATVVGAIFAMIWNYNGYKFFVFSEQDKKNDDKK